jgi:hypothetical protein
MCTDCVIVGGVPVVQDTCLAAAAIYLDVSPRIHRQEVSSPQAAYCTRNRRHTAPWRIDSEIEGLDSLSLRAVETADTERRDRPSIEDGAGTPMSIA